MKATLFSSHRVISPLPRRMLEGVLAFFAMATLPCCTVGGSGDATSGDWTIFRGESTLTGRSSERIPSDLTLLYSYKGGKRTLSSPVVSDGVAYWCDIGGKISGVDVHSGELAFTTDLSTQVEATALIVDSLLYIGTVEGNLLSISLKDGGVQWSFATEGQISSSPNLATVQGKDALIVGSYDNFIYCVQRESGTQIGKIESGYYINGAVAVKGDLAVLGGCDAVVRVIDCSTATQIDSVTVDSYIPGSPAIDGNKAYVMDYGGDLLEVEFSHKGILSCKKLLDGDGEDGSTGGGGGVTSLPAIGKDCIYAYTAQREISAISRKDGRLLWTYGSPGPLTDSSPLLISDKVAFCTRTGVVSVLDGDSGKLLFQYDCGEQILGSPAPGGGGRLLVLTAKGTLLCFGKEERKRKER